MGVRKKLLMNAVITVFALAVVAGAGFIYTRSAANISLEVVNVELVALSRIQHLRESSWVLWLNLVAHTGVSTQADMQALEDEIGQLRADISKRLGLLERLEHANSHAENLSRIRQRWGDFLLQVDDILRLSNDFTKEDALNRVMRQGRESHRQLLEEITQVADEHREHMQQMRSQAEQVQSRAGWTLLAMSLAVAAVAVFLILRLSQGLLRPLLALNRQLKLLARGELPPDSVEYQGRDEVAEIIGSTRQFKLGIESTIAQANAIAAGNYQQEVVLLSEHDQLGLALSNMTRTLREVSANNQQSLQQLEQAMQRLEQENQQRAQEDWIKTGQNQLNQRMSGSLEVLPLAESIVQFLTEYTGAAAGLFYRYQPDGLFLVASHHFNRRRNLANRFAPGEGLVGQVALERKYIVIDGLAEDSELYADFINLEQTPQSIVALPFFYEDKLQGVVEIDFSQSLRLQQLDFLKQVMPAVGVAVAVAESRLEMQALLQRAGRA